MDCNNCVCALCCRYAQDNTHREKIRSGEVSCCDYYPRPDDSLKTALKAVSEMNTKGGIPQGLHVLEECSELIKEFTKKGRGKSNDQDIIAEACDVLASTFVMLEQYGVTEEFVRERILYKYNRALERHRKTGEL